MCIIIQHDCFCSSRVHRLTHCFSFMTSTLNRTVKTYIETIQKRKTNHCGFHIGREGHVTTRSIELDAGPISWRNFRFTTSPQPLFVEAVLLRVRTRRSIDQHYKEITPYHYFELQRQGVRSPSANIGMTSHGF
jgi:hypothetical protein